MVEPLRVLLLEDVASDARLTQHELRRSGLALDFRLVATRDAFGYELEAFRPNLVLADYSLPGFDGLTALQLVRECDTDLPFIFVSGAIGEERAIEALRSGATDYVLKDHLVRLVPVVQRALQEAGERAKRRAAEEELRHALDQLSHARDELAHQVDSVRRLSSRLVQVQEGERRAVARELHDSVAQDLTSLIVELSLLGRECPENGAVAARIEDLQTRVSSVLEDIHQLGANLVPASLDKAGLVSALRQQMEEFRRRTGLSVALELSGVEGLRLSSERATALFRILQESLANVAQHASATRVGLVLARHDGGITLIVEDDGTGFDPEAVTPGEQVGILSMRERAEMLGGHLTIESEAGRGTTVFAEMPYDS